MRETIIQPPHDGRRAFNGSICLQGAILWMAYRVSHNDKPDTLRICRLDRRDLSVIEDWPLSVPVPGPEWGAEDPRLFLFEGRLWVSWTCADYSRRPWKCGMFYGQVFDEEHGVFETDAYQPIFGLNDLCQREKNWQFFAIGEDLFAQYAPSPNRVIHLDHGTATSEWKTPGFAWACGRPSGGTPPILTDRGTLLSFFHSWEDHPTHKRLYYMGAMEMAAEPPFRILRVSKSAFMRASRFWPFPGDDWNPLTIFPGGAVHCDGKWLVSCGCNDAGIRIFEFSEAELELGPPKFLDLEDTTFLVADRGFLLDGRQVHAGDAFEATGQQATKLLSRGWASRYENQTHQVHAN